MISTDFAPNEDWKDALISISVLFQPWKWKYGEHTAIVKKLLLKEFQVDKNNFRAHLFLSGRSALYTILQSLRLTLGSEVIIQAFTCEAVILPIIANKLKPIFADIEMQSFSMNPIELEKKITPKTKVVILQHTFGIPPFHKDRIQAIVKKHKLVLIEDIAHGYSNGIISKINPPAGGQKLKNIFLLSFGRSKALSSVFGSAILTNNIIISNKLEHFERKPSSSYWFIFRLLLYKPLAMIIKSTYDSGLGKLLHKIINSTRIFVPEISAIEKGGTFDVVLDKAYPNALSMLLHYQLKKFEQIRKLRALICEIYNKNLKNQSLKIKGFSLIRYPIIVGTPQKILDKASKHNIFLGKWYDQVVAPKSVSLKSMKYESGSCKVAENLCQHIVNLPTTISIKNAYKIIKIVEQQSI